MKTIIAFLLIAFCNSARAELPEPYEQAMRNAATVAAAQYAEQRCRGCAALVLLPSLAWERWERIRHPHYGESHSENVQAVLFTLLGAALSVEVKF